MIEGRLRAWLLALALSCLAVAASGCGRPHVTPVGDGLAAVEPTPHESAEKKDADGPLFQFPNDAGGALLAKVLPPTDVKGPLNEQASGPRPASSAGLQEPPPPPSPRSPLRSLPVRAEANRTPPAPRLVADETLGLTPGDPAPPVARSFPVAERTRVPSVDVNQPIPLPILAQPTADRAPLDDPTADPSAEAVSAAPLPQRKKPAPYVRITVPDPFDNRRPLTLPVPAEDDNPRTGTARLPRP